MEPNLLVGDRLFVSKFSYGYSKHSFPFSPPIIKGEKVDKGPKKYVRFICAKFPSKKSTTPSTIKT